MAAGRRKLDSPSESNTLAHFGKSHLYPKRAYEGKELACMST